MIAIYCGQSAIPEINLSLNLIFKYKSILHHLKYVIISVQVLYLFTKLKIVKFMQYQICCKHSQVVNKI